MEDKNIPTERILHDFKYLAQEKKRLQGLRKEILETKLKLTEELQEIDRNEDLLFKQLDNLFLDLKNILNKNEN